MKMFNSLRQFNRSRGFCKRLVVIGARSIAPPAPLASRAEQCSALRRRAAFTEVSSSVGALGLAWLLGGVSLNAAPLPGDWQYVQSFSVATPGLTKVNLPSAVLDTARSALEDLRLYDAAGTEVPYVIERPAPTTRHVQTVKSFQVSLQAHSTVITIETGLAQPLDTLALETPATDFLKPVQVEGSADGRSWQILAQGQPIFRQLNGANRLQVSFPSGTWAWLRLTVDDRRYAPIPFTGARVHAVVGPR